MTKAVIRATGLCWCGTPVAKHVADAEEIALKVKRGEIVGRPTRVRRMAKGRPLVDFDKLDGE